MKKWMFLSMVFAVFPAAMLAQDDMYFASDKSAKTTRQEPSRASNSTYYSGSSRSVDEYNRRLGSSYAVLPADTGDVISFAAVEGAYPDSVSDFQMTRQMQRWDDYVPSTAYWEGYAQGQRDSWGWHSPWYYSAYYPWYDSWYYDPWYYDSWYYGWHRPWYGGYYGWGWGYPYHGWYGGWTYYPGGHHHVYYANRQPGTINRYGNTHGGFTGNRSTNTAARSASVRSTNASRTTTAVRNTSGSGNFTGNRSTSTYNGNSGTVSSSRNTSTSNGGFSGGGGGFSGGRSGGGSMGGDGGRSGGSRR